MTGQEGNDLIRKHLTGSEPLMVARLGKNEAECLYAHNNGAYWSEHNRQQMLNNAGVFPINDDILTRFCNTLLGYIKNSDIFAQWLDRLDGDIINKCCPHCPRVALRSLEPYYHENPWSKALEGKTVLVIHPFQESIESQYRNRKILFKNEDILPEFELKTIKAVMSHAGEKTDFQTWFDARDYMFEEMEKTSFDVAIIGAGAYGIPLANHAKTLGKKAVHMAGATQILFGIKGRRWDVHEDISKLYNEHWVRPIPSETPSNCLTIEGGCYW